MTGRGAKARVQTLHVRHELARLQSERDRARQAVERAHAEGERLRDQASRDALTGLHNRRHLDEVVAVLLSRAVEEGAGAAVATLDIDHFKAVNDTHGHGVGDRVLVALAELLRAELRKGDAVCRVGGEEFLLVLPGATLAQAVTRCERLLAQFRSTAVATGQTGAALQGLSFSCGVTHTDRHGADMTRLWAAADSALYRAKGSGRSQVSVDG